MLRALVAAPEAADVVRFVLGIDAGNAAGRAAAGAAGFVPLTTAPDAEGTVFVQLARGSSDPAATVAR